MASEKPARYESRQIIDWLRMVDSGEVALPSFQRSYVWKNQRIADYLTALFQNRPTGTFIILSTDAENDPVFVSRAIDGTSADRDRTRELILDGQQRLTALWRALTGQGSHRFFAVVKDITSRDMTVQNVVFHAKSSAMGKKYSRPGLAAQKNLVPIDILYDGGVDEKNQDDPGPLWRWCETACEAQSSPSRRLERAVWKRLRELLLLNRELHYCVVPKETPSHVAIDIFVDTNQSSATIRRFDLVVALAEQDYGEDLRRRIGDWHDTHEVFHSYFSADEGRYIPEIGEWALKVACLRAKSEKHPFGLPPKEQHYDTALCWLLDGTDTEREERLGYLLEDLRETLDLVGRHGATTRRTLPAWPPLHVIAALWPDVRAIGKPTWSDTAHRLVAAYLWRSFVTDRYEAQANDRLFEDCVGLKECLEKIKKNGRVQNLPPAFDEAQHPIPAADGLVKETGWIGRGRRGLAIAAAVMESSPLNWVTGEPMDVGRIRELERSRRLDRHHVFPKDALRDVVSPKEADRGMNGVLLSKAANLSLARKDPRDYLQYVRAQSQGLSESILKRRVESHLVPYEVLVAEGPIGERYRRFVTERAERIVEKVQELCAFGLDIE